MALIERFPVFQLWGRGEKRESLRQKAAGQAQRWAYSVSLRPPLGINSVQGVWLFCPGVSQVDTGQSINIRWADEVELRNPERGPPEKLAARPPSVTLAVPPQDGCPWAEQDPLTVGRETGGGASAGGGPLGARPLVSGLRPPAEKGLRTAGDLAGLGVRAGCPPPPRWRHRAG